jgi:predicted dehydrogenase
VNSNQPSNRRDFLKTTSAAAIASAAIPSTMRANAPTPRSTDRVRIALVGAGGRGTGAARDNLSANPNTELVAIADLKRDKAVGRLKHLKGNKKIGERVMVKDQDIYGGLEGLDQVLARKDVDLVLLTTPPGFRPEYVRKTVAAGKHVFAEKPVCVDPAGYRICCEAHDAAVKQGTAIVTGTQYRRQTSFMETIDQLHKGIIGDIVAMTARYCSSGIWYRKREAGMTDMEYQIHNWMHFVWLSGDQIAEQAVHNIDVMNWVMQGPPERCYASGGRFFRPDDSEMWDTMSIDYEYPGKKLVSFKCRQLARTDGSNDNVVYCDDGVAIIKSFSGTSTIMDASGKTIFKSKGNIGAAYKQEHKDLVDSITAGKPIVELRQTAESSLTAVMGRMSAYTGKRVDWDFVTKKSQLDLYPKNITLATPIHSPGHALPGRTKLI